MLRQSPAKSSARIPWPFVLPWLCTLGALVMRGQVVVSLQGQQLDLPLQLLWLLFSLPLSLAAAYVLWRPTPARIAPAAFSQQAPTGAASPARVAQRPAPASHPGPNTSQRPAPAATAAVFADRGASPARPAAPQQAPSPVASTTVSAQATGRADARPSTPYAGSSSGPQAASQRLPQQPDSTDDITSQAVFSLVRRLLEAQSRAARPEDYLRLGVRPGASEDEVKRAYRAQALVAHPDTRTATSTSSTSDMLALNAAYSRLKAFYDRQRLLVASFECPVSSDLPPAERAASLARWSSDTLAQLHAMLKVVATLADVALVRQRCAELAELLARELGQLDAAALAPNRAPSVQALQTQYGYVKALYRDLDICLQVVRR